jgi:putative hydrolase of the HAD superfamily
MPRLRAVVFDLDDTLYPESAYVRSGFRALGDWAEERLGVPAEEAYAELEALFRKGVRGDTFDRWLAARGIADAGLVSELVRVYRAHRPAIEPFPEAPALLDRLGRRYALGILSDGEVEVQSAKLDALGLRDRFTAVLVSGELGRDAWKPSPLGLRTLLERMGGVAAGEAAYLADNPAKDFIAARVAGMLSVRLRHHGGIYSSLEPENAEHAPDSEASGLDEVEAVLERLQAIDS